MNFVIRIKVSGLDKNRYSKNIKAEILCTEQFLELLLATNSIKLMLANCKTQIDIKIKYEYLSKYLLNSFGNKWNTIEVFKPKIYEFSLPLNS